MYAIYITIRIHNIQHSYEFQQISQGISCPQVSPLPRPGKMLPSNSWISLFKISMLVVLVKQSLWLLTSGWGSTPLKINMEHNHGGLEDHFSFLNAWFVGSMLIFQGVESAQLQEELFNNKGSNFRNHLKSKHVRVVLLLTHGVQSLEFNSPIFYLNKNHPHSIHVWYIYLHLPQKSTKCRYNIPYMDGMGSSTIYQFESPVPRGCFYYQLGPKLLTRNLPHGKGHQGSFRGHHASEFLNEKSQGVWKTTCQTFQIPVLYQF